MLLLLLLLFACILKWVLQCIPSGTGQHHQLENRYSEQREFSLFSLPCRLHPARRIQLSPLPPSSRQPPSYCVHVNHFKTLKGKTEEERLCRPVCDLKRLGEAEEKRSRWAIMSIRTSQTSGWAFKCRPSPYPDSAGPEGLPWTLQTVQTHILCPLKNLQLSLFHLYAEPVQVL